MLTHNQRSSTAVLLSLEIQLQQQIYKQAKKVQPINGQSRHAKRSGIR